MKVKAKDLNSTKTYLNTISNEKLLTFEEEQELGLKSLKGDLAAREKLTQANLRLVVMVAKQFKGKTSLSFDKALYRYSDDVSIYRYIIILPHIILHIFYHMELL